MLPKQMRHVAALLAILTLCVACESISTTVDVDEYCSTFYDPIGLTEEQVEALEKTTGGELTIQKIDGNDGVWYELCAKKGLFG